MTGFGAAIREPFLKAYSNLHPGNLCAHAHTHTREFVFALNPVTTVCSINPPGLNTTC